MQLSGGGIHSLGIRANGTAWAWGGNAAGSLGDNTNSTRNSPVSVIGGFTDWVQISAGRYHSVAVRASGSMWSWGSNDNSQLGDNSSISQSKSSPVLVVGGFTDWIQVSAGNHTLGLRGSNSVLG
jgi:alpha-tubulin suppressor-like RCC1 family protein